MRRTESRGVSGPSVATATEPFLAPDRSSDTALVRAARLGDHDAFAQILNRYGPGMYRFARRLCSDDDTASDAVQDAFVSAWKSLPSFEQRSSLKTWLYRLVHRRATDLMRVRRPVPIDDRLLLSVDRSSDGIPNSICWTKSSSTRSRQL